MIQHNTLTTDISWVYVSQILILGMGFLLSIILGRFLGPENFGLYSLTFSIYSITIIFASLGIPTALIKYVAEYQQNPAKISEIVSNTLINCLFLSLIVTVILIIVAQPLAQLFLAPELSQLLKIIAISIPLFVMNSVFLGLLNGLREMKSYSTRSIVRSLLMLTIITILIAAGFGVRGAILGLVLTELGIFFLLLIISRKFFRFVIVRYAETTKEIIRFGSKIFYGTIVWSVYTYIDPILIGYILTTKDVGIFALASIIARTGFLAFPTAVSTVMYPVISELRSQGKVDQIQPLINNVIRYCLIVLSILSALAIIVIAPAIVVLFRQQFLPAVLPTKILLIDGIFFGSWSSVGAIFTAMNRPDINYKISSFTVFLNILLAISLIPLFGITGAALAAIITHIIFIGIAIFFAKKIFNLTLDLIPFMKIALGLLPILLLSFGTEMNLLEQLLGVVLWGLFIFYTRRVLLTKEEWENVWDMLRTGRILFWRLQK